MFQLYIIHFDKSFHGTRHYIGFTSLTLEERLKKHQKSGSRFTRGAVKHGILLESIHALGSYSDPYLAREAEIKIKKQHNSALYCPLCKDDTKYHRAYQQRIRRKEKKEVEK